MKYILLGILLLVSLFSFGQEQWSTLNITGQIDKHWSVAMEGEQRYSYEKQYIRYFHYDFGLIRKVNSKLKIGLFYREIYEIKKGQRVIEHRPHIDAFYQQTSHLKWRIRLEQQYKEIDVDGLRFRVRPTYELKRFKQFDPFVQTELNFTEAGFTRNRFNVGVTINIGKLCIQPAYLAETLHNKGVLTTTNAIWVNNKISF